MDDSALVSNSSLDDILNRMGFGWFQVRIFLYLSWITFSDGAEITVISLITKILKKQWNLDDWEEELMGAVLFLGMIIGTFMSGPFGDKFGRRITLFGGTVVLFTFGMISAFMPEYWSFVIVRAFVGMSVGFLLPLQTAYEVEVCTEKSRGGFVIGTFLCFQVGMLSVVLLAFWLIPDLDSGNWRLLLILVSIPSGVSLLLQIFWGDESPRYEAINERFDRAVEILNKMAKLNKKDQLTQEEMAIVKSTQKSEVESVGKRIAKMFGEKYLKTTLQLFYLWFMSGFVYYGLVFILPRSLSEGSSDSGTLVDLTIINTLLIPAAIVPCFLIENKSIGRRKTLLICLIVQTAGCVLCSFFIDQIVFISAVSVMLFLDLVFFDVMYPYTSEIYDTGIRSTGLSVNTALARFGGFISPFVLVALNSVSFSYPYIAFSVVSLIALVDCYLLKYESRGQNLDNFAENVQKD